MQFSPDRRNVELHLHLDGALRPKTLFEEAGRRNIDLPYSTWEEMQEALHLKTPSTLTNFLRNFDIFIPIIAGDKEVLSRCAWEFMEDCANKSKLAYVETRFAPHFLSSNDLDGEAVTVAILDALQRASVEFGVAFGGILCNLVFKPEVADDLFRLALKYKNHGVVGIDLAGDESLWADGVMYPEIVKCYDQAKTHGIHRTVHAGESGTWRNVKYAVDTLHAERIGHGYHLLDNEELYADLVKSNLHFEVCPTSSFVTGAVPASTPNENLPLNRLARDGANYSINTDDPLLTGRWLVEEHQFCRDHLGWPIEQELVRSRVNAARAAFIDDEEERDRLVQHVSVRSSDDRSVHKAKAV